MPARRPRGSGPPAARPRSARRGRQCRAPAAREPPWDSATARTIESPRPELPAAVAAAADEALEDRGGEVVGHAGTVVLDRERRTSPSPRRTDARICVPSGRVAHRVLHQVEREPVQLVARPVDDHVVGVDGQLVAARDRLELGRRLGERRRATSVGSRGARAAGVGAREQQQVGDQPAHAARRAQRGGGGLALLARRAARRAARGWRARWSAACAARARRRRRTRAGARAWPRSRRAHRRARAASPRASRASSATSSSASGWGRRRLGSRVRSISRAAPVSSAIGAIARRAIARPASSASAAPPSTPKTRKKRTLLSGRLRRPRAAARTGARRCPSGPHAASSRASTR